MKKVRTIATLFVIVFLGFNNLVSAQTSSTKRTAEEDSAAERSEKVRNKMMNLGYILYWSGFGYDRMKIQGKGCRPVFLIEVEEFQMTETKTGDITLLFTPNEYCGPKDMNRIKVGDEQEKRKGIKSVEMRITSKTLEIFLDGKEISPL